MAHIIDITKRVNGAEYEATIEFDYKSDEFDLKILEIKDGFLHYNVSFLIRGDREEIINQLKNMEW